MPSTLRRIMQMRRNTTTKCWFITKGKKNCQKSCQVFELEAISNFHTDRCATSINGKAHTSSQCRAACHRDVKSCSDYVWNVVDGSFTRAVHCRLYIYILTNRGFSIYIIVPRDSGPLCRIDRAVDGSSDERRKDLVSFIFSQILFLTLKDVKRNILDDWIDKSQSSPRKYFKR